MLVRIFFIDLYQHWTVSCLFLNFLSISVALLYSNTPHITIRVPNPDRNVTGLPNSRTDNQINRARFAVFATLQKNMHIIVVCEKQRLCIIFSVYLYSP